MENGAFPSFLTLGWSLTSLLITFPYH